MLVDFDILFINEWAMKKIFFERGNKVTIYLDFIWALNFLFDFILLILTSLFVKRESQLRRLIFGAFIASLIVPLTIIFPNYPFSTFFGKIIYSLFIVLCAFPFKSLSSFLHTLFSFYFISFIVGGGLIGVHYLINNPISMINNSLVTFNKGYGDPISWLFVLICFPFIALFTKRRFEKHTIEKVKYDQLYPVFITINDVKREAIGYMDSGNQLVDPLTNYPVIIADKSLLMHWFNHNEWLKIEELSNTLDHVHIPKRWKGKINLVPYRTIQGENKILIAIKPEVVSITSERTKISTKKVFIGIHFSNLSKDKSYNCLLQPRLFQQNMSTA